MIEILKRCFEINLSDYENISFSLEINKVVLGAFIAVIAGVIYLNIYRGAIRLTVSQLTRHGARTEESAKTLSELGLASSRMVKHLLSGHNMLTDTVARAGAEKQDYETYVKMSKEERREAEKINFDDARFYIRESRSDRAAFILERYSTSPIRTAVTCIFFAILCGCIIACMPGILNVINEVLGNIKK
jgi:hypothetical protein